MDDIIEAEEDIFKTVFKYYKRKKPPPDLNKVLQIGESFKEGQMIPSFLDADEETEAAALGLISHKSWRMFNIHSHPGLFLIQNPFSAVGQMKWIKTCLTEYPRNPNKTNLESHGISLSDMSWWELAKSPEGRRRDVIKKLRWVTLGYHHNWDTKEYSEEMRGVMPKPLERLCVLVAKVLGISEFHAEAAIINFYHEDSSLGPHTDHSEPNMNAPLFSFSFGQDAVFLIGGSSKSTSPDALYLHSGDILVMSGSTRLAYHAVPRIVLVEEKPWLDYQSHNGSEAENCLNSSAGQQCQDVNDDDFGYITKYLETNRINMNVRQVLFPSQKDL